MHVLCPLYRGEVGSIKLETLPEFRPSLRQAPCSQMRDFLLETKTGWKFTQDTPGMPPSLAEATFFPVGSHDRPWAVLARR